MGLGIMKKQDFAILLLLAFIGAIFSISRYEKKRSSVISVYIHGTLFNWSNILSYVPGAQSLLQVPDGLTSVRDLKDDTIVSKLSKDFASKDPYRFVQDKFYAFGWSGHLSFEERKKSAEYLAQELQDLEVRHYLETGHNPVIRIVAFSHGGNVALNLAHFLPKDMHVELVLIACPVQAETEQLVEADCFSKVYSIASLNDVVQVSDPQHIYRNMYSDKWLSKRFFETDVAKVKQACVSVNGTYLGHCELFNLFNQHIPMVLNRLDALLDIKGRSIAYIDVQDPGFPFLNGRNVIDVLKGRRYDNAQ